MAEIGDAVEVEDGWTFLIGLPDEKFVGRFPRKIDAQNAASDYLSGKSKVRSQGPELQSPTPAQIAAMLQSRGRGFGD